MQSGCHATWRSGSLRWKKFTGDQVAMAALSRRLRRTKTSMATVAGATGLSDRRMAAEPGRVTSSTPAITFASLEAESRTSHHLSPLAQLHSAFCLTPSGAIKMITRGIAIWQFADEG